MFNLDLKQEKHLREITVIGSNFNKYWEKKIKKS